MVTIDTILIQPTEISGHRPLQPSLRLPNTCFDGYLQWDDPWNADTHDFDWYLLSPDGKTGYTQGETYNVGGVPEEHIHWCNNTGLPVTVADEIFDYGKKYGGDPSGAFLKYIGIISIAQSNYIVNTPIAQYNTASEAISPDAASANGALTVAAVPWYQSGAECP